MAIRKRISKKSPRGYTYQVYFDYRDDYGIKRHYYKSGFKTSSEAKKHEILMRSELIKGNTIEFNKITLDELIDKYLLQLNVKPTTKQQYRYTYDKYCSNIIGQIQVSRINSPIVQELLNSIDSYTPRKLIKELLSNGLKFAYMSDLITKYILLDLDIGTHTRKITSTIDDDTFFQFIEYLESLHSGNCWNKKQYILASWIGFYTGMRIGEVFALRVDDIDFYNHRISVSKTVTKLKTIQSTKTESSADYVPMTPHLEELLQQYLTDHKFSYLLTRTGEPINHGALQNLMKKFSKLYGVDFHFHSLRHTLATKLYNNNVDVKIAQKVLRHSSVSTTLDIYTHIENEKMSEAVNSIFLHN